jgi:tetratricopeptide (TPR) repeat protein
LLKADFQSQVAQRFAVRAYKAGDDIVTAKAKIDQVLSKKADANLYAMRASYKQAAKDYQGAIADLEQASKLNPKEPSYQQAIRAYKILFAESYDLDARLRLLGEYNRLARENPSDRDLFFNRAVLMEKCGLSKLALDEYDKLFEGSQVTASQLNNRGVAMLKAFHLRDARSQFEQAIARDGSLAEPHFNLAVLYAYQGLERLSVSHLESAIERAPRFRFMIFNNPAFSVLAETERFQKFRD